MLWFFKKVTSPNKIFKIFVNCLILLEIRNKILGHYIGGFETIADVFIGEQKQSAAVRVKVIEHFESCSKSLDVWIMMQMILFLLAICFILKHTCT